MRAIVQVFYNLQMAGISKHKKFPTEEEVMNVLSVYKGAAVAYIFMPREESKKQAVEKVRGTGKIKCRRKSVENKRDHPELHRAVNCWKSQRLLKIPKELIHHRLAQFAGPHQHN